MGNLGTYTVGNSVFENKASASYYASGTNQNILWNFDHDVWQNFSNTSLGTLGRESLDSIYARRAQQLRDKYDYLILNYSGGADSHNILMTFINNGIKLDEVFVRWSERINSKLYTPNTTNVGAENLFSEWDFVIKPSLNWLAQNHPNIKINIQDPFDISVKDIYNDNLVDTGGHYMGCFEIGRQRLYSSSIDILAEKGKKVASIYGIDKPLVVIKDNMFFMFFSDAVVNVADNISKTDSITELFYYSRDMPELPFEQAYSIFKYFAANKPLRGRIDSAKAVRGDVVRLRWTEELTKSIIYTTWDHSKFQVRKPLPVNLTGRSRDLYYMQHPELQEIQNTWNYYFQSWYKGLDNSVLTTELMQKPIFSKWYYIGYFNDQTTLC